MLASFVLAASASSVLTGRTVSWWRLTASVGLGQLMFHVLFSGMGAPVAAAHDHAATAAALTPAAVPHVHGMLWAHIVAGVITIVALRYGASVVSGLAAALRFVIERVAAERLPVRPVPVAAAPECSPDSLGLPRPLPRRGPPVAFAHLS
jgi:hypothetical protein